MSTISEFRILTTKDVQSLLECSPNSAKQYIKDIKLTIGTPKVLLTHFKQYFKIST